jgi:hypothetical protein
MMKMMIANPCQRKNVSCHLSDLFGHRSHDHLSDPARIGRRGGR